MSYPDTMPASARRWKANPPQPGGRGAGSGGSGAARVLEAMTHMRRHLARPLRVSELAGLAGVSEAHFFALFKWFTGRSPLNYFIRLRMCAACGLLERPGRTVMRVAEAVGYPDPFYFSRVFKATCGVAPSDYRRLPVAVRQRIRTCGLTAAAPFPPVADAVSRRSRRFTPSVMP